MARFTVSVTHNLDVFKRIVRTERGMTEKGAMKVLDDLTTFIRDEARKRIAPYSRTFALQKSIRKRKWKPPFGYFYMVGVSAGGFEINPDTGKIVDYAEVVEYGSTHPDHYQEATPYFWPAWHMGLLRLDSEMRSMIARISRRHA